RWTLIIVASLSAFLGAYLGAKWLQKVTIRSIQLAVSALLILLALGMIAGVL
ncbi:MAG: sulfite exporter TauE/SafE family protein, partial [Anaerolineales bacterium]|nr:sulfite exporter TauE/SafE family protein [Anaerolineales bacterium]